MKNPLFLLSTGFKIALQVVSNNPVSDKVLVKHSEVGYFELEKEIFKVNGIEEIQLNKEYVFEIVEDKILQEHVFHFKKALKII